MVVKTRREEYAALTRAAIVDSARTLFVDPGYADASIDAIATAARVSKGAVYHHFADKRAIFEEVLRSELRSGIEQVVARTAESQHRDGFDGRAFALAGATEMLTLFGTDPVKRSLLQQGPAVLGSERIRRVDEGQVLPLIRAQLTTIAERGQLRPELPIPLTARIVYGLLLAAAGAISADPDPDAASEAATRVVDRMITGLFVRPEDR
ncbi:TetR/AcrR family transcriptional regulator [Nocardia terpenica]|uniref:TetR/AcrR family transcriptional regulator n=1 Tax=Nocardia terpenica TaxID=455432 RepID=UPI002FE01456